MLTFRNKLIISNAIVLVLLVVIAFTGIKSISNLSKTANKMEVEYIEVNVVQELQISFEKMLLSIKNYIIKGGDAEINKYNRALELTKKKMVECRKSVTYNHNKKHLSFFDKDMVLLESLSTKLFKINTLADTLATKVLMEDISSVAQLGIDELNEISIESEREMNNYIEENRQTNENGKNAIVITAIIVALCLLIFSFFFMKGIIAPLNSLTRTTQKISSGNLSAKANIESHDEIGNLMDSFNNMISILNKTTVSRDYFDNILNRMDDALVIIDTKGIIIVANQSTLNLLGYSEEEIIGLPFGVLLGERIDKEMFAKNTTIKDLKKHVQIHNIYNTYYTKQGDKIPILFSGSLMLDDNGLDKGMICIANHHVPEFNTETNASSFDNEKESRKQIIKTVAEVPLTKREREIMKLIAEELSNLDIAEKLFISVRTVETHRKNIMQKLHVKSVISLVKYAALNEII